MRQLPLAIGLADHAVFSNFQVAGNEELLRSLGEVAAGTGRRLNWLWGAPDSGRSHLLQACVAAADEAGRRAAYLPLSRTLGLPAGLLEGLAELDVVCIDDLQEIAGSDDFERGLFRLYEQMGRQGAGLVIAAAGPPAETPIGLRDLASRLAAGVTFRVRPLDDAGRLQALQQRARFRGFDLPDETGRYLLSRVERSTGSLFRLLDELDRAALAARKRLTIPFVKQVLGG